jgi:hypothetical protein
MAVTEVIHFPLWAQLDPCLPFPAQIPSESVSLFPPKLLPMRNCPHLISKYSGGLLARRGGSR